MPDQKDPLGILGDSTKQTKDPLGILTGEPVKKKDIGGLVGGLFGSGGVGRSVSSRIVGGIKKLKPKDKPDIASIESYNKNFQETTGTRADQFSLGSDLPQIKKAREESQYLKYRDIEENELKPVVGAVRSGTASPKQLQELYSKPYGRKIVSDVVTAELPELAGTEGLDADVVRSGEKWAGIAQQLQAKNREAGVAAQNQAEAELDKELAATLGTATYGNDRIGVRGGGEAFTERNQKQFGQINTQSAADLAEALRNVNSGKVWDAQGKEIDTKGLAKKLQERLFQVKAAEPLAPEIADNRQMILDAVSKVPVEWKRKGGENADLTNRDTDYIMAGLNYIRDTAPGEYAMIMGTMQQTGQISETQFTDLANLGRDIQYFKDFKSGKYVEPDERSLLTPQLKKAAISGKLSEILAAQGYRNKWAYTQKEIRTAANALPQDLKDEELINEIIKAERAPAFGFLPIRQGEGIVKKGGLSSFMRGVASPLQSVEKTFDVTTASPFEAYLNSKKLDVGDQTIINSKGQFTKTLDDNFWNKAAEGAGSFFSQLLLARGFGSIAKYPVNQAIGRVYPMGQLSNFDAALKFGTPLSTLAQTYGDEYLDFLEKTGSPTKAALGAFVSGLTQGVIEKNIMPDVLIAKNAELLLQRKNLAKEIIDVIDNGGGKAGIADVVKKFVGNTVTTLGKEAWVEENLQNLTNYLTEAIISPQTIKDRNLLKETIDTGTAATVMMTIPAIFGAAGETKMQRSMTRAQLNSIAANPKLYLEAINNQFSLGQINEQEKDLATKIISLQAENNNNAPRKDANGENISAERQLEYAYQSTVQQIAEEQASKIKDPIQKEPFEKKIQEADKIKRQIFYGEEAKELPPKEGEPIIIDQDRDLMDEEEQFNEKEQAAIDGLKDKDFSKSIIKPYTDVIQDESLPIADRKQALKELSDQLTAKGTEIRVGEELGKAADLIYDLGYPVAEESAELQAILSGEAEPESGVSVQMPGEVAKPQTTEIKPADAAATQETTTTIPPDEGQSQEQAPQTGMAQQTTEVVEPSAEGAVPVGVVPPVEPPAAASVTTEPEGSGKKKSTLNRLYEAKGMPERAREAFEKEGLEYVPASQEEAAQIAAATVDELGIDEAVDMAAAGKFNGGVNALIFGEALNRLADKEDDAGKWAEVAILWDKYNRVRGQDIAAINFFYKTSPLGIILKENADRKEQFNEWAKWKDQSWKEYFDELMKEPEFAEQVKEQVKAARQEERKQSRQKRESKIRDIFKKAKVSKGQAYSTIIPPDVWNAAVDLMEKLYLAGEAVVEVVQKGVDYITAELKGAAWDSDKFRKEWEAELSEKGGKAPLSDEELKAKVLKKFSKKLKGLTDDQKDEVIRKSYKKIIESGGLDFDEFKDIIARVTGRGEMTDDQKAKLKDMVAKTNAAGEAEKAAQAERTPESLQRFYAAEIEAGRAARDLRDIFRQKPDILRRLTSIMQLSTLGAVSLVANVTYNFWNQAALRYPIGLINDTFDRIWGGIARMMGKPSTQEYNVWEAQGEFWNKLGQGAKEAFEQIGTGLNRQDYTQKELYGQQMRPFKAIRELWSNFKGKRPLTRAEWWDKMIEGTAGIPAELVARFLNVGDKPMRFAAGGTQAKAFTKALGLKDIDERLFIEFPQEEAYRYWKGQGLSDAAAQEKADYIAAAIKKEGERATLQQDNLLSDAITRAAGVLPGGKDSGIAALSKTLVISPYIKIPTNAFWSYYNLVNPEVGIMQALTYAGLSKRAKNKGDNVKAQLLNREARYWFAHAIVGMGLRAVAIALVQAGRVTPPSDDDESKKERDAMAYFDKPGTIQIGDTKYPLKLFGVPGMIFGTIARKQIDAMPEQRENQDDFWNIVWGGMERDALMELENGVFANSSSLFQSISTGDFSRYGINTINLFANIIQPATIAQINRAALDEVPTSKGDTFLDRLNQNFAQRSTLYRRMFDVDIYKKQDIFGRPIPKGGNWLSRMFGISKANPQLEMRPLYDDYLRTGDSGFLPPAVPTKIGDTKLTIRQQEKFAQYVGEERLMRLQPYISGDAKIPVIDKSYKELESDEKRKDVLQSIYERGRRKGLDRFYKEYPEFKPAEKTPQQKVDEKLMEVSKKLIN